MTHEVNEAATSWLVAGRYELVPFVKELIRRVPALSDSVAQPDGRATSARADVSWFAMDAPMGCGVFLVPKGQVDLDAEMRGAVLGLDPDFEAFPGIFGNFDRMIWGYLGSGQFVDASVVLSGWPHTTCHAAGGTAAGFDPPLRRGGNS